MIDAMKHQDFPSATLEAGPDEYLVVSIDPGQTVGWSVSRVNIKRETLHVLTGGQDPDYTFTEALQNIIKNLKASDLLVVEEPPQRGNDHRLVALYGQIIAFWKELDAHPQSVTIVPGLWKPWIDGFYSKARRIIPVKLRHMGDSVCMAVYSTVKTNYNHRGGQK